MKNETRGWPPKRRTAYAARIRKTKIWCLSTGPRSADGKTRSSRNAITHGAYTAQWKLVRAVLLAQRQFLKMLEQILKIISIRPIHVEPRYFYLEGAYEPYRIIYPPLHEAPDICDGNIDYFFGNVDGGLVG